jgi:lipopolysaccharide transport system permease protein
LNHEGFRDDFFQGENKMFKAPVVAYWNLVFDFSRREIEKKYRGSYLGFLWLFLSPFLMLAVYTFVYSFVFRVKITEMDRVDFVLWLYAGLAVFFFFSDVMTSTSSCIRNSPNYVKKVIFPLEVLVSSKVISACFSFLINFLLLVIFLLVRQRSLQITILLAPLMVFPTVIFAYGLAMTLAAVGVFIQDTDEVSRFLVRVLFYLAPIVYPLALVPQQAYRIIWLNPLTNMVEPFRSVTVLGKLPEWDKFLAFMVISIAIFFIGRLCFQKLRPAFADVL